MNIRDGKPFDRVAIMQIEQASAEAPHWPEAEYRRTLAGRDNGPFRRKLFVWNDGEGILGFSVGTVADTGDYCFGELESIVVSPRARRKGIGRALCRAVLDWAEFFGADLVSLEVRAKSVGAIALYLDLGFQSKEIRKGYYRSPADDAVVMDWVPENSSKRQP